MGTFDSVFFTVISWSASSLSFWSTNVIDRLIVKIQDKNLYLIQTALLRVIVDANQCQSVIWLKTADKINT